MTSANSPRGKRSASSSVAGKWNNYKFAARRQFAGVCARRFTTANVNSRRPYLPGIFGPIFETETAANANYNALQITFTGRFACNISLLANYTFSKSINMLSDDPTGAASVSFVNSNNLAQNRAVSGFNTPHVFSLSWVYQVSEVHLGG